MSTITVKHTHVLQKQNCLAKELKIKLCYFVMSNIVCWCVCLSVCLFVCFNELCHVFPTNPDSQFLFPMQILIVTITPKAILGQGESC